MAWGAGATRYQARHDAPSRVGRGRADRGPYRPARPATGASKAGAAIVMGSSISRPPRLKSPPTVLSSRPRPTEDHIRLILMERQPSFVLLTLGVRLTVVRRGERLCSVRSIAPVHAHRRKLSTTRPCALASSGFSYLVAALLALPSIVAPSLGAAQSGGLRNLPPDARRFLEDRQRDTGRLGRSLDDARETASDERMRLERERAASDERMRLERERAAEERRISAEFARFCRSGDSLESFSISSPSRASISSPSRASISSPSRASNAISTAGPVRRSFSLAMTHFRS